MKKLLRYMILFGMMVCFAGCNAGDKQENNNVPNKRTEFPDSGKQEETVQEPPENGQNESTKEEALLENRRLLEEKMEALETMNWTGLTCYADEETSLLNSNLLSNFGFLTYDKEGTIYFADKNIGGIFVSDWNGKNRRQLTPDSGSNLQIVGDWLYYLSTDNSQIKRIHRDTGEVEMVSDQPCSAFVILDDKMYTNGSDGFCVAETDGTNKTILHDRSMTLDALQAAEDGLWLGNVFHDEDYDFLFEGHLLTYDETRAAWCYIEKGARYPLLAGNWLSVNDKRTGKMVVWDLKTDTKTELDIFDNKNVSDGTYLYSCSDYGSSNIFYRWNGEENEELFRVESELYVHYKYLTPDKLYWMQTDAMEKWLWELWYYDLETGETGVIY